ncbi:MAG: hypothetical protein IKJ38_00050 [Alistipes sp.]|nr:hypothetical protein [Alistipes sp.]
MIKKLSVALFAFVLGVTISVGIQACANEEDNIIDSNVDSSPNNSGNSGNSDDNDNSNAQQTKCYCQPQVDTITQYGADGEISGTVKYSYDNNDRMTGYVSEGYIYSNGKRYTSSTLKVECTYSSSGDIRYETSTSTSYDENGNVIYESISRTETKFRMK